MSCVVFVDDILREDYLHARAFIYSLVSEPIRQALGACPSQVAGGYIRRGLIDGFDEAVFRRLSGNGGYESLFYKVSLAAESYLEAHIPNEAIVVGYEMPPWLLTFLRERRILFMDIRISPVRFARDLYAVVRGSNERFSEIARSYCVPDQELRLEANFIKASIVHNSYKESAIKSSIENRVYFIGQTKQDSSLITEEGFFCRVGHFSVQIRNLVGLREVFYVPHPYSGGWSKEEKKSLEKIIGRKVKVSCRNIYSLLADGSGSEFFSISSGVIQEANFFDKKAVSLLDPICDFRDKDAAHIRFVDLVSPRFWADFLEVPKTSLVVERIPYVPENMMRRLHNSWWGYSDYLMQNDNFWWRAFRYGMLRMLKGRWY